MLDRIILGSTLNFTTTVAGYSAADGWTLKFRLVPRSSGSAVTITTAADGDLHSTQVSAATTSAWTAGTYSWFSWVEKAAEKYDVASGSTELVADPRSASTLDLRTSAEVALDNVNALLAGKASAGTLSYRIGDRELRTFPMGELLALQSQLKAEVAREKRAAAFAAGQPDPRRVYVRVGRG